MEANNFNSRVTNSIFEEPWWLDAVAPGQWESLEVKDKDGSIIGRWPICYGKILGFKTIRNPIYTQTLGPWIKSDASQYTKYLSQKKKVLEELIKQLPKKPYNVFLTLDSSNEYILPFRWSGFSYTPTFSYRFTDLTDLESIFQSIGRDRRKSIKRASKILTVRDDCPLDILFTMIKMTNDRQNRKKGLDIATIRRIDEACKAHNARKYLVAQDQEGNIHAACYFVYDERVCYGLVGGADPRFRGSDAQSLILWEAIKFASTVSSAFDFRGSNVEFIEHHFRSFGSPFVVNYEVKRLNLFLTLADTFAVAFKKYILKQHV